MGEAFSEMATWSEAEGLPRARPEVQSPLLWAPRALGPLDWNSIYFTWPAPDEFRRAGPMSDFSESSEPVQGGSQLNVSRMNDQTSVILENRLFDRLCSKKQDSRRG